MVPNARAVLCYVIAAHEVDVQSTISDPNSLGAVWTRAGLNAAEYLVRLRGAVSWRAREARPHHWGWMMTG